MLKKGVCIAKFLSDVWSNIMNLSEYLMFQESSNVEESDNIDYCIEEMDDSGFGDDKLDLPEEEGFRLARKAAKQFANASDGEDTDIDLDIDDAFPSDDSGFNESFDQGIDLNTVPAASEEDDQFSDPNEEPSGNVTDRELATDDDDFAVEESATGWDDLF